MDPLSLASGITGLIAASDKIASLLFGFTSNLADAPLLARNVVSGTQALSGTLLQLQPVLWDSNIGGTERRSMVFVDQLALTLASCVLSLAELERELEGVVAVGILDRLKWTVSESTIRRVLESLQMHESSLTLVLTILTVLDQKKAEQTMERLGQQIERAAESNRDLVSRIAAARRRIQPQIKRSTTKRRSAASDFNITVKNSFEAALLKTKVYRRPSTVRRSYQSEGASISLMWSQLSGLSLAQIENLAVMELPLCPGDVGASSRHYDFRTEVPIVLCDREGGLEEEMERKVPPRSARRPSTRPPPLLLVTPPDTPHTLTHCDSPLPPLPPIAHSICEYPPVPPTTYDCPPSTPPQTPGIIPIDPSSLRSLPPSTHRAITQTLMIYVTLRELVPAPPPTWETGTNFRHKVSQFTPETLKEFATDVHDEILWRRRGGGDEGKGGDRSERMKGVSDTQLEHWSADVVWEVQRRFASIAGGHLEGNAF